MAVQEQTPYIEYTANGVATSFALGFDCESKDHLIVTLDGVELPVGNWSLTDGVVVFTTAPSNGVLVVIQRNTPFSRTTDYQSYNNSFRPPAVNKDFDWIWLKLQELGVADWILSNRIDALKNYVDDRDDELRAYLMEEIRKQGVALDQLEDYYNYLMQRLAQIAVDKGWDASFVVDGDRNQKQINNQAPTVLQLSKVHGDGTTNDSAELQKVASAADNQFKNHIKFPTLNSDFLVDETVVIQEPTMLIGDAAPTYNRGDGKSGKIIIGDTDHAFDLGNYRSRGTAPYVLDVANKRTKNPADQWTIKNLAFIQKTGQPTRSKTALLHTSRTNGPDRGLILKEVSGTGLKHLVRTTNSDLETQIATVAIDSCCASNNAIPFKFDGATNGGLVTNSQIEQNTQGAFHGYLNGPWHFINNMLEGQPNAIKVEVPPVTGNRTMLVAHGNYFEVNSGDYVAEIKNSAGGGAVDFAYNWSLNMTAKDYIRINESASLQVFNKDARPVTFYKQGMAEFGSDFLSYRVPYWVQRDFNTATKLGGVALIEKYENLHNPYSSATQANALNTALVQTPLGSMRAATANTFMTVPINVAANDVVQLNMFVFTGKKSPSLQVYNSDTSIVIAESGLDFQSGFNRWTLVTLTIKSPIATTALRIRLYDPTTNTGRVLAAASAKILTLRADGYSDGYDVYPELPALNVEAVSKNYTAEFSIAVPEIAADGTYLANVTDVNFLTDDVVVSGVKETNTPFYVHTWVASNGAVKILVKSIGAVVSARTITVKVKAVRD